MPLARAPGSRLSSNQDGGFSLRLGLYTPSKRNASPYDASLTVPDISLVRNASAACSAASSVGLVIFAERTVKKLIAAPIINSSHQLKLIMVVLLPSSRR